MKKTLMVCAVVAGLAVASAIMAKADEAGTQKLIQPRKELRERKKMTFADLKQEKEQWKIARQENISKFKEEKEKLKLEFKEKFTAERCAKIQEKVQNREQNFEGAKAKHTSAYTNLVARINKFIARFDAQKLDTTVIKGHLAELETKIAKFQEDYVAYSAKLKESKNFTCGHSEGEFKGALLESKALLKTVHADAADIRTFVRTTIFADLRALKAQMPKEAAEAEATDAGKTEATDENNQ